MRLRLETLEDRSLMSVDLAGAMEGIDYTGFIPPDTITASSSNWVVELVNSTYRVYDHAGNQALNQSLKSLFAPLGGVQNLSDPVINFDQLTGQFVIGILDYNQSSSNFLSRFDLAASNDDDPHDGWTFMRYDMNDGVGGNEFADYPKFGYNADGWFASFNMFLNGSSFNHVDTLAISKADLSGTRSVVPGGSGNFTLAPASILDANPGDPEWLVERGTATTLKLFQITNVTDAPALVANVSVPSYSNPPGARQPGGSNLVPTIDDRIMNATMIYGQLLTDHTVASGGVAHARWYQIDTTQGNPYLYQWGEIDQGAGVYTYFPSIAMNYEGDIGLTFMESSPSEYVSMYVTGQSVYDSGSGQMQDAVDVFPGTSYYAITRAGDYSGISVDPSDGYTFWAANEYKGNKNWNTGIAAFGVSPNFADGAAPQVRREAAALGTVFQPAANAAPVPASAASPAALQSSGAATVSAAVLPASAAETAAAWAAVPAPLGPDDAWFAATGLDARWTDESLPF